MADKVDVVVAGLGAMGGAAAAHLARRGKSVVGFDRFAPPHTKGSSHGGSRVIREAYWEDPIYVPMVQRAYELWAELEQEGGKRLFRQTGALFMGVPDGVMVPGCRRTAQQHKLRHRNLTAGEARKEFPLFRPDDDMIAFYEYRAGILDPESAVRGHLDAARRHGARLHTDEPVLKWSRGPNGVRVQTAKRTIEARDLVLATGAWMPGMVSPKTAPLTVERQVLYWFEPRSNSARFAPDACPIYAFEPVPEKLWYGFPDLGHGPKVALHHQGEPVEPDRLTSEVRPEEIEGMRDQLRRFLPDLEGKLNATATCLYTNTPDFNYLIDFHPDDEHVLLLSPCSGHGFKYASVVGEIAADLVMTRKCRFDLRLFRAERFRKPATASR